MTREPIYILDLLRHLGSPITKEMLLGRGYCRVKDYKVIEDNFPRIKELSWEENEEEVIDKDEEEEDDYYMDGNEITSKKVKKYIAEESRNFYTTEPTEFWMKGIPANPADVGNQELYMILFIEAKSSANGMEIAHITPFARMVRNNNCMFYILAWPLLTRSSLK